MYNAAFRALDIEAEYRLFDISEDALNAFFSELKEEKIAGCNVTIPYKEKALAFIDGCDDLAKNIGAVNTIALKDAKLTGYNTDCQGFIESLQGKGEGDLDFDTSGKNVFVFGAGGAAKAVVYALISLGAKKVALTDIDIRKAEALADSLAEKDFGNTVITVVQDESQFDEFISKTDLLVNATPCGMKKEDPKLFDYKYLNEGLSVFDLIYSVDTLLVKEAQAIGARAVNGLNMLLYQAAAAFKIWTGKRAPVAVMKKALKEGMNR